MPCAAMASCGGGFGFVGAFASAVSSLDLSEPRGARGLVFFASPVVSCPCSQSWDAQRGCMGILYTSEPKRKKPGARSCNCNWAVYDVHRPSLCKSTFASTSSDHTAVARKILREEIAFRPRTRRESAARCWKAARHGRTGLRAGADWIEHWARAQPPTCRVKRRVGSAPRAAHFSDVGQAALCSRLTLAARDERTTRRDRTLPE